ncbi:MAG: tRNA 2-thiouridine(34) synthase MnmA [Acidimicrobiaceae bacterium]|nr:tRNA 2-thiouridine(34) synthase MnmA [Acidimicrobiaceae bacterium]
MSIGSASAPIHGGPVMVAMSGGVDSSVAAALLLEAGYEVVGVTMKLWGGPSDTGCCAVSDVDDARRVADRLGVEHHVFNFGDDFERDVVGPYVADHAAGRTPNPCIECNRHLKFDRLLRRADALGFSTIATGHHARVVATADGLRIGRGADTAKDQSYVLHMLDEALLSRLLLPLGQMTKVEVRRIAAELGLRTAAKPESQDVCFITNQHGREAFLGDRIGLKPGVVIDRQGVTVGRVDSVELVTVGQRKGLGLAGGADPHYVIDVDPESSTVTVGTDEDRLVEVTPLESWVWTGEAVAGEVELQCSAHGKPARGEVVDGFVRWRGGHRRIATGQSVVAYRGDLVIGGGIAARDAYAALPR